MLKIQELVYDVEGETQLHAFFLDGHIYRVSQFFPYFNSMGYFMVWYGFLFQVKIRKNAIYILLEALLKDYNKNEMRDK